MDPDAYLCQLANVFNGISVHSPTISAIIAIVLAGLLLLVSGFASASEIAFFSLSPSDLNAVDEKKHPSDEKIRKLLDDTERLLATILITNNFVNVTIIMLCNFFFMSVFEFHSPIAEFLILTVILTFLLLLFGEIMPKIYSAQKTLAFCRFSAPGIWMFRSLFYPVASMLVRSTSFLNKHFARKNHNISVDELSHALELTDKAELKEENNILEGIIRFGGETAKEVMTSRLDVVDLDIRTPFKDVLQCIIENAYSRIPIYSENRDNIKGILYIKDLLPHLNKVDFRWQSLIRPAYFVPETKMIDDLLRDFQANKIHIAIVVDEFGGTSGIVTMEDIIEEIVGEIHDEYDDEERTYAVLNDHTWVFEAKTQLTDFYKITKVDEEVFDEVAGDSDTLAGLLLELKGEFPALHEKVTYDHYEFEVLEMDNR
ncbi:gliding motility-associated protein GldE, partial [Bacteroides cellulosilyticus]